MRKRNAGKKFHRTRDQRRALMQSLARNLITHQKILTTEAKAKELRPFIEKLVTKARQENVATIRYLMTHFDDKTVWKLTKEIAPKYTDRAGGYTRITKVLPPGRNGAKSAYIEFV